jgi:glycosyltransferase involved in cell wall biosynthesis
MTKTPYHIAHVLPFPSLGGTETSTLRIAQGLRGGLFRHTAFCLPEAVLPRQLFADAGFATATFAGVQPSYWQPLPFLKEAWRLAREFRRRGICLVHCADVLGAYFTALAGRLAGLPVLCHVRNRHRELTRRDLTFLRPVNRFVFVSQDAWRHFPLRVPAARGALVYDGLPLGAPLSPAAQAALRANVLQEFQLAPSHKLIGMVARVAPQKDYFTLAAAAARVLSVRPEVRFLLIGDCSAAGENQPHYEAVRARLAQLGVRDKFIFTGHRADVPRLLAALDLFVLCTHTEGFGLVLLEALAQSRPVLATAVEGTQEIIEHEVNGLLHEHQNDQQFAEQMLTLLADEERATRLGQAGRRRVETTFSETEFLARLAAEYQILLSGAPPVPAQADPGTTPTHALAVKGGR